jgi:hypothetical protein
VREGKGKEEQEDQVGQEEGKEEMNALVPEKR